MIGRKVIDLDRLRAMEADFGAAEVALIVTAFLAEASAALGVLGAGWADQALRRERLHFLKGGARTIGAIRLGDLCERFEGGTSGPEDCRALDHELAAVRKALAPEWLREAE